MCNRFRTAEGETKPGDMVELEMADGTPREGVWAGFAQNEKLTWWKRAPDTVLAQTRVAATEIAEKANDTHEIQWAPAPEEANLLFVLEPVASGKSYALARMITTAATEDQAAYFRHGRFPLLGKLEAGEEIVRIEPLKAPPSKPKAQGELF